MGFPVTFKAVRIGHWLVDEHGQVCPVVKRDRTNRIIETRRFDRGGEYDVESWTEQEFDDRKFQRTWEPRKHNPKFSLF